MADPGSESRPQQPEPAAVWDPLVGRARALVDAGGRRLLGITGPPGAGKSTAARWLTSQLGTSAVCVPMDGFHLAQRVLADLGLADRKGAPETFDADGFRSLLERLRSASEPVVYAPDFRRDLEEPIAGAIAVPRSVPLVIVEGNYLLVDGGPWRGVSDLFDEIWYLEVAAPVRQQRLVDRHHSFGRTVAEARAWVMRSDEPNAQLVQESRRRADRVVPTE